MINKKSLREQDNSLMLDFNEFEDYDSFDIIAAKIISLIGGEITAKIDGPESRIWDFIVDGENLTLHNNPYGNYLKATTPKGKVLLQKVFELF